MLTTAPATPLPEPSAPASLTARLLAWAALAIAGVLGGSAVALQTLGTPPAAPPPRYATLAPFELTDQRNQPFGSEQLRGSVWIANFIFTRCPTVCPVFSQAMAELQPRIPAGVKLVSFSVDPAYDTPEVLASYATKFDADPGVWTWLTGTWESVRSTVRHGMKLSMENNGMDGDVPDIIHGTHFVLVDAALSIRGYYDSTDPAAIDAMLRDAALLAND